MANILVTGANGQLGSELNKIGFSILDEVFFTDIMELDITSYDAVKNFVERNEIDTIINCAAYTAVDKAEDEVEKARKINVQGAANLAKVANTEDCLLIHISTDYIFDGTATEAMTEKTKANPLNVYGETKSAAEEEIKKSGCMYIIIRTSWLYSSFGTNFVKTILKLSSEKDELSVVSDQIGSPTYARDLADAITVILENENRVENAGIYNFCNSGECSWYDFAKEIVYISGHNNCEVKPVSTGEYPAKAVRPKYSVLDTSKIQKIFNVNVPDWKDALNRCIDEIKN